MIAIKFYHFKWIPGISSKFSRAIFCEISYFEKDIFSFEEEAENAIWKQKSFEEWKAKFLPCEKILMFDGEVENTVKRAKKSYFKSEWQISYPLKKYSCVKYKIADHAFQR